MVFDIYYQNVRGLRTKTLDFKRSIQLCSYNVIVLTETWLWEGIRTEELFSDAFTVWRRDRDYGRLGQKRGGGVLIAVRRDLAAFARPEWHSTAEDLWITVKFRSNINTPPVYLHIGCLYLISQNLGLPLTAQLENFSDKVLSISAEHINDKFLILGDFNQSSITWTVSSDHTHLVPTINGADCDHFEILDLMNLNNLDQFNLVPNMYDGGILDLVLSNDEVTVVRALDPLLKEDKFHPALVCRPQFINTATLIPSSIPKFLYAKGDYSAIHSELNAQDWHTLLSCDSLDDAVVLFNDLLSGLRDKFVPCKWVRPAKFPIWYSPALLKILKEKHKHHRKFKIYHNLSDRNSFRVLRERVKKVERECYFNYIDTIERSIRDNPKAFWSYIKSNKQHNTYPSSMTYNDKPVDSGVDICNAFADFFNSNYLAGSPQAPVSFTSNLGKANSVANICTIEVSTPELLKLLKTLDCNKSAGPDGLHPHLLVKCAESLIHPVSLLFNRSVTEGVLPSVWKSASITPIHKKGPKRDVSNYRPISKLCVLVKVFEKLVHDQLYAALKHTFLPQQHGFLKGRSTTTNLVSFVDEVTKGMEGGGQVDAVYTDYRKAFDRLDHSILLAKLYAAGIGGDLLRWFTSYVNGRTQTVALNGFTSDPSLIPSGVPQGSILGPLLFIIFVNDIDQCFKHSNFLLFADDMKIFKFINNFQDLELLQLDLDNLRDYCAMNKLDLNISKCCCITFSRSVRTPAYNYKINGQSLMRTDSVVDLGVTLDSKLLFSKHIENISTKAMKTLGFILRITKDFKLIKTLKILYCSLVRSQLEYASQVWNPCYDKYINILERPQKKFLRFINFKAKILSPDYEYDEVCFHHHLLPVQIRREAADLTFLSNIVSGRIDCPSLLSQVGLVTPLSSTPRRRNLQLYTPRHETNYRGNSFFIRTLTNFNRNHSPNVDLFMTRHYTFKNTISKQFFDVTKVKFNNTTNKLAKKRKFKTKLTRI